MNHYYPYEVKTKIRENKNRKPGLWSNVIWPPAIALSFPCSHVFTGSLWWDTFVHSSNHVGIIVFMVTVYIVWSVAIAHVYEVVVYIVTVHSLVDWLFFYRLSHINWSPREPAMVTRRNRWMYPRWTKRKRLQKKKRRKDKTEKQKQ